MVRVYAMGFIGSTIESGLVLKQSYCEHLINYYFCEILPMIKLTRSSTYHVERTDLTECLMNYGWRFVTLYRRQGARASQRKTNARKQNSCLRRP